MGIKKWIVLFLILGMNCSYAKANKEINMVGMKLEDFLSNHNSDEDVVAISAGPKNIYVENGRHAQFFNFDFTIEGLSDKELTIRFIKVAVYDAKDRLLTFRYLNHNAVGTAGIQTIGKSLVQGKEKFDIYNPFYEFPKDLNIHYLRYMFTFFEKKTGKEFYYGNIVIRPVQYKQKTKLAIPLKGLMAITDGHDYYSHHRRFEMSVVKLATDNQFQSNFSRFALDFTLVGKDGNFRKMEENEKYSNYDFHFTDIKKFYTHNADVFSPADGEVVDLVNNLDDLYDRQFDLDKAIKEKRVKDIAGNYVIIKHNDKEFSHLFHLEKGSINVKIGQKVKRGQKLGRIGFSGTAAVYSHLHYQLMNGKDFLKDEAVPFQFSNITLIQGVQKKKLKTAIIDTGDLILNL
ncbi:MAG: M23 family metallopeptidase [Oligoflexia bacterium]|nr:M23 family metallopeptidase [Oligoflexia bacterium]